MTRLRCFADSADLHEVNALLEERLVHGVTTNPEILRAHGVRRESLDALAAEWIDRGAREVFFQTWGEDAAAMMANAEGLLRIAPEVGIKVPATGGGFGVAARLADRGVSVLVTAVYEAPQALYAASIGARYIAPYLGRLDDAGRDGVAEIATMAELLEGTGTEILAASLREPQRLVDLALRGVTCFTAKPEVLRAALTAEASDAAAVAFEGAMRDVL